jgi:FkbM family methyltransferase
VEQAGLQHRVKTALRLGRRKCREILGKDISFSTSINRHSIFLGTEYGGWSIIPDLLPPAPCVFSVGIGQDISFDLEIIRRFNATVYGFDPTPKAMAWIKQQNLPSQFHFVPIGLAHYDGMADFGLNRPDWESYSTTLPVAESVERAQCRVARLTTLTREVNVKHIDVLKIDIEGSEYDAVPDLLSSGMIFGQFCLELHYVSKAEINKGRDLLQLVKSKGYQLFDRTPVGKEFCFVHQSVLDAE